ncbi:MAG: hypothetical protein C4520_04805, partial [Candidatus Abyssobacteria bacterium SURF_5]
LQNHKGNPTEPIRRSSQQKSAPKGRFRCVSPSHARGHRHLPDQHTERHDRGIRLVQLEYPPHLADKSMQPLFPWERPCVT